ncbi:MAG: hypothetical protein J0M24_11055 [Verrucomicrobia bacterium]|nr:hypothetical protein [Verrucomicrobiota bacterium]
MNDSPAAAISPLPLVGTVSRFRTDFMFNRSLRSLRRSTAWWLLALAWLGLWATGSAADRTWRWSSPLPHGNNIAGMAFRADPPLYVQVTDFGQVYLSSDREQWQFVDSGQRKALRGVAFLGQRLLVGGEEGIILWADDPQRLHLIDLGTFDWIEGVAASPQVAVAVGDNGAIYRSETGTNWVRQAVSFSDWLRGVAWGNGRFVAVGDNDGIFTSSDGSQWTRRTVSGGRGSNLNKVSWTGDGFVVAGDAVNGKGTVVLGSANAQTWTWVDSGAVGDLVTAAGSSTNLILAGGDIEMRRFAGRPVNAWTNQINPIPDGAPPAVYLTSLWDGERFLLGGRTGRTVTAVPDGLSLNWGEVDSPPRSWLFDLCTATGYGTNVTPILTNGVVEWMETRTTNTFLIASGDYSTVLVSDEGVRWLTSLVPVEADKRTYLGVAANQDRGVAVGTGGLVSISPVEYEPLVSTVRLTSGASVVDVTVTNLVNTLGLTWYATPSPTTVDLQAVCATSNLFVIGGSRGFLATSSDGTNWTARTSGSTAFLSGVEAGTGGFVAVGDVGTILTSPDAVTWTRQASPTANWIYRVRQGGDGTWVAVGEEGTLLTSTNRTQWTQRPTGLTNWLNDAEWAAGTWYVVGNQGVVLTSTNAVDWVRDTQIMTGKSLYAAAQLGKHLIVAGVDGIILRSRVEPFAAPVRIESFAGPPENHLFLFSGELDQRFRLERSVDFFESQVEVGPVLEINPEGRLLYLEAGDPASETQGYRALNVN